MAYADHTTGGRTIIQGLCPVQISLSEAVEVGDLIGVSANTWKRADANADIFAELVAGHAGASGDTITAYRLAVVGNVSGATKGNKIFLSNTAGENSETAGAIAQVVGVALTATEILLFPMYALGGQLLPNTITDKLTQTALTGTATVTAAQLLTRVLDGTPTAAATYTLPTAALLVAAIPGAAVGDSFTFIVNNKSAGANTITLASGAGGTDDGTLTVAQNVIRTFQIIITNVTAASEAYFLYGIG